MKIERQGHVLHLARSEKKEYPIFSITVAFLLLYAAPFITSYLAVISFVICLYRMIRYDARVFATDYCLLAPLVSLTKVPGVPSLLIYLALVAGIWYFIRGGIRADASYVFLILLLNYLLTRMQMDINAFVLCFGQMFFLCVLLPKQDADSAERAVKAFCLSLVVSSIYAWLLRNTAQIKAIMGAESVAIWGTSIMRFKGLFQDPNYYTTLLIVALTLLVKLKDSGRIRNLSFWVIGILLTVFGILTYSKTFFVVFVLLGGIYVVWQFWNKKVFRGIFLTVIVVLALSVLLTAENSPFAVVLTRLTSAKNLSDLTTNRSEIYMAYLEVITANVKSFFFGQGLAADSLYRDPHNIYLEAAYYVGVTGLILIVGFYASMVRLMVRRTANAPRQNLIAKYVVLFMVLVLYFTLHGIFQTIFYTNMFVAFLSIMLTRKEAPEKITTTEEITKTKQIEET